MKKGATIENSPNLFDLRLRVAKMLCGIEDMLPKCYSLTLVARHHDNDEAHLCVTIEKDVNLAIRALKILYDGELK